MSIIVTRYFHSLSDPVCNRLESKWATITLALLFVVSLFQRLQQQGRRHRHRSKVLLFGVPSLAMGRTTNERRDKQILLQCRWWMRSTTPSIEIHGDVPGRRIMRLKSNLRAGHLHVEYHVDDASDRTSVSTLSAGHSLSCWPSWPMSFIAVLAHKSVITSLFHLH